MILRVACKRPKVLAARTNGKVWAGVADVAASGARLAGCIIRDDDVAVKCGVSFARRSVFPPQEEYVRD